MGLLLIPHLSMDVTPIPFDLVSLVMLLTKIRSIMKEKTYIRCYKRIAQDGISNTTTVLIIIEE